MSRRPAACGARAKHDFFAQRYGGTLEYEQIYELQGRPKINLLRLEGMHVNLDKINPRIRIFGGHGVAYHTSGATGSGGECGVTDVARQKVIEW